jgi:hypothetical protein
LVRGDRLGPGMLHAVREARHQRPVCFKPENRGGLCFGLEGKGEEGSGRKPRRTVALTPGWSVDFPMGWCKKLGLCVSWLGSVVHSTK